MGDINTDRFAILHGDAETRLYRDVLTASIDIIITSFPYYMLRNYGVEGQIGWEPTPEEFVARIVGVLRQCARILRPHGLIWAIYDDTRRGRSSPYVFGVQRVTTSPCIHRRSSTGASRSEPAPGATAASMTVGRRGVGFSRARRNRTTTVLPDARSVNSNTFGGNLRASISTLPSFVASSATRSAALDEPASNR